MQFRAPDRDPIRVLLGPMPDLLREMLEDLLSCESDMVVLGQSETATAALTSACEANADMLIMQSEPHEKQGLINSIVEGPPFSIFAISATGEHATAVRFVHEDVVFDASSRSTFAAAIRRVARSQVSSTAPGEARWPG
jgi:DNA-binding NarL/FixJ family response regulator